MESFASVLIITKNEELDLPGCLDSVAWSDDIHVFDSFSTDQTVEIAEAKGAMVTQRVFDGYASQRNAALHGLTFKHPWVLILDADERVPIPLRDEISDATREATNLVAAFRIQRRDFLFSTWLKHAQISPFYIRLVRPDRCQYEREVNEVLKAQGTIMDLMEPYDHFPFSKGISHWVAKHNQYSSMEAARLIEERENDYAFSWKEALCSSDFNVRRYHQKGLFYKMPARPLLKWAYMIIIRRAVLDGYAGITYATLQAIYEYLIQLKADEILRTKQAAVAR